MQLKIPSQLVRVAAVLTLGATVMLAPGCGFTDRAPDVRKAVEPALRQLGNGHPREGFSRLLGRQISIPAWQRGGRLYVQLNHRAAVGQANVCAINLRHLMEAVEIYRADDEYAQSLPEKLSEMVGSNGFTAIPTCPAAGADTYSKGYKKRDGAYRIICTGTHHREAGLRDGHPVADSRWGLRTENGSLYHWWPDRYEAQLLDVQAKGDSARVKVRETSAYEGEAPVEKDATLELACKDGKWTLQDGSDSVLSGALTALGKSEQSGPSATVEKAACHQNLQRLATALEMWSSDHDGGYPASLKEVAPRYLRRQPTCPADPKCGLPQYELSQDQTAFALACNAHQDVCVTNRAGVRDLHGLSATSEGL